MIYPYSAITYLYSAMTYLNRDITYPYGIMIYCKDSSLRKSSSLNFHSNLTSIAQELSRFITMTYLYEF